MIVEYDMIVLYDKNSRTDKTGIDHHTTVLLRRRVM